MHIYDVPENGDMVIIGDIHPLQGSITIVSLHVTRSTSISLAFPFELYPQTL